MDMDKSLIFSFQTGVLNRETQASWKSCKACAASLLLQGKLSLIYTSHKYLPSLTTQTLLWRLFEFVRERQDKQDPCEEDSVLRICTSSSPPILLIALLGSYKNETQKDLPTDFRKLLQAYVQTRLWQYSTTESPICPIHPKPISNSTACNCKLQPPSKSPVSQKLYLSSIQHL